MAINHWYWKRRKKTNPSIGNTGVSFAASAKTLSMAGSPGMYMEGPREVKDLGLAIEPIVGIREYHIYMDGEEPTLSSFNGCPWPHRQALIARCGDNVFADHDVPKGACGCGIYAWKPEHSTPHNISQPLSGEVYLWGDVLVCEHGYRAEIAYPKNLNIRSAQTRATIRLRDALEEAYGVPVTLSDPKTKEETRYGLTGATGAAGAAVSPGGFVLPTYPGTYSGLIPPPPPPTPPSPLA